MRNRRPKNPISKKIWEKLEERDYIKRTYDDCIAMIEDINSGRSTASAEDIKAIIHTKNWAFETCSIRNLVDSICDCCFEDYGNFVTFSERFETIYKSSGLTLDEIADELGISHTAVSKSFIHKQKTINEKTNSQIYRHYLAAYSLIFEISPYYLIGFTDDRQEYSYRADENELDVFTEKLHPNSYSKPVVDPLSLGFKMIEFIKTYMYIDLDKNCPNRYFILPLLRYLCNAKKVSRDALKSMLFATPTIKNTFDHDLSYESDKMYQMAIRKGQREDELFKNATDNLFSALTQLYYKDFYSLKLVATIMKLDGKFKESIYNYLSLGGILDDKKSCFKRWEYAVVSYDRPDHRTNALAIIYKAQERKRYKNIIIPSSSQ